MIILSASAASAPLHAAHATSVIAARASTARFIVVPICRTPFVQSARGRLEPERPDRIVHQDHAPRRGVWHPAVDPLDALRVRDRALEPDEGPVAGPHELARAGIEQGVDIALRI